MTSIMSISITDNEWLGEMTDSATTHDTKVQALRRLAADQALASLEDASAAFNLFTVLRISRLEFIHSNLLAWLLDPRGSHRLGDTFLRAFLDEARPEPGGYLPGNVQVLREFNNIDICIIDEAKKVACVVENKIMAPESAKQLTKYWEFMAKNYPEYKTSFIFLTPHGHPASHHSYFCMSYRTVANLITQVLATTVDAPTSVCSFLHQYEDMLRRHILKESEVQKLCRTIIRNHKAALDVIADYKRETLLHLHNFMIAQVQAAEFILDEPRVSQKYTCIRFTPKELDNATYKLGKGWTKSRRILLFELYNHEEGIDLGLYIGPGPYETRRKLYEKARNDNTIFKDFDEELKPKDGYNTLYYQEWFEPECYFGMDIEQLESKIKDKLHKFKASEMPRIIEVLEKKS